MQRFYKMHRCEDHPRIRGEHYFKRLASRFKPGSSPHSRGTLTRAYCPQCLQGIIPAFAGNTFLYTVNRFLYQDHPRIRGEHTTSPAPTTGKLGSSPHSRGTPCFFFFCHKIVGIIPAFAGNTLKKSHKIAISQNRFFKFHLVFHKSEML